MKKLISELSKLSVAELKSKIQQSKQDIAKARVEMRSNPMKDTNFISKKRKEIAQLSHVLNEKETEQILNKEKN